MNVPAWLDREEAEAWRGWIVMTQLLQAQLARDLQSDSGLSDADYTVLVRLSESPDERVRMTELATSLDWSKSRLSHQVARMEARGLVQRQECPSDARGAFAVLTPLGRAEIHSAAPAHVASVRRHFIDLLDREQLAGLTAIADRVLDHLRSMGCPGALAPPGAADGAAESEGYAGERPGAAGATDADTRRRRPDVEPPLEPPGRRSGAITAAAATPPPSRQVALHPPTA